MNDGKFISKWLVSYLMLKAHIITDVLTFLKTMSIMNKTNIIVYLTLNGNSKNFQYYEDEYFQRDIRYTNHN